MKNKTYLSIESMLLLLSKSIIISSEQIDSHGDNVSSDSVRVSILFRGFIFGVQVANDVPATFMLRFVCAQIV